MKKIYLHNFKGFTEQFIELSNMNFFVGENSTGKTSILKLINLLSNSEFWQNPEFNTSEIELGYFYEILNKNSKEKSFKIGVENEIIKQTNSRYRERFSRILFEFKENKSIPYVSAVRYIVHDFDILIKISKRQLSYYYKERKDNTFKEWVYDNEYLSKEKRIRSQIFDNNLYYVFLMVNNHISSITNVQINNVFIFNNAFFDKYVWLAPIRAKSKRIYESYRINFSPEGDHIPSVLRNLLTSLNKSERNRAISILEKFGKSSNLFDRIEINELGSKNSSPFEILISYKNVKIKLPNVGYGVSQSLPLIVEILSSNNTTFSIQQPEVHLHPKAQAAFGSFLFKSALEDDNMFIVETHSDFTINRYRYRLSINKNKDIETKVFFFERKTKGNCITEIKIDNFGNYIDDVPNSYRDFFIDEELKLLDI